MSAEHGQDGPADGSAAATNGSPILDSSTHAGVPAAGISSDTSGVADSVLNSDIGINTLLNRLKQSIASARDFAQFLRKRSTLEEEQAKGLKRLASAHLDEVKRADKRGGSYALQLAEAFRVHEKMADNGMQFALSLHQMHEDLDILSANMERGRKQWKHEGLDAEKKATDAETAMQKAKARYDSLAEDYDRARTGDTKGSRRLGLKGPKSAEQYEQDLFRKTEAADSDYKERVRQAQTQREQLFKTDRPKAVRALQELVRECDSALTLQLQKFATFNEKLLLGNGLVVSPLSDRETSQLSLREMVAGIDNERDLNSFVSSHSGRVVQPSEIKYEQHPTLVSKTQQPRPTQPVQSSTTHVPTLSVNTSASQPGSTNSRHGGQPASQPPSSYAQSPPSAGYSSGAYQPTGIPPQDVHSPSGPPNLVSYNSQATTLRDVQSTAPYPTTPNERLNGGYVQQQQTTGTIASPGPQIAPSHNFPANGPRNKVFGVSLDDLFARDQSAVPIIVFQCIQAIDFFGLETEGIYRHNGNHSHVTRLREAFDNLPPNSPQLDFRNPSNFYHDVNAVSSLLKSFFRDLPDPVFTRAGYGAFVSAAKEDDESLRRDALHQSINDLPDPNYATLRAVVLHLGRVMQNESRTRMTAENLAVCFAPTLMGSQTSGSITDASWQSRALATILANANAIFDED